ncbi:diguanylate cyclase (GGDEF) domain-containing protein [Alteromonadaceae bacterium Bs31]|nr:diguanylate cyclase (GGDEF) domain-containing protein [Alteromonadaceae bacterium Bs31]
MLINRFTESFRLLVFILLPLTMAAWSHADKNLKPTEDEAKAHYTYEILKHTNWPAEDKLTSFHIGLYGTSPEYFEALSRLSKNKLRGKTITLSIINSPTFNPNDYALVYIASNKAKMNTRVFEQSTATLIITAGQIEREHLLYSLLARNQQIKVEFNRDNLIKRGFDISINMLAFAGNREDMSKHLREQKTMLLSLRDEVDSKKAVLDGLNAQLKNKNNSLEHTKTQYQASQSNLTNTQANLEKLLAEIEETKADLAINHSKLKTQGNELKKREQEIEHNKAVLSQQLLKINQQVQVIHEEQRIIGQQRTVLMGMYATAVVFALLALVLFKLNHARRSANKKLKALNARLYELATRDGMTNLFNRKHFLECAQTEFLRIQRTKGSAVLLMADLDKFKSVNDIYGHASGDEVLKVAASILKEQLRPYDIVGRLGGEEFALMLVDCSPAQAKNTAERLRQSIADTPVYSNQQKIDITISIGLSNIGKSDSCVEDTLKRADKGLYEAKTAGRNRIFFQEENG